jgi:hypothetical protein
MLLSNLEVTPSGWSIEHEKRSPSHGGRPAPALHSSRTGESGKMLGLKVIRVPAGGGGRLHSGQRRMPSAPQSEGLGQGG